MPTDWVVYDKGINLYLENMDECVRLTVYPWTATEKAERIATDLNSHAALVEALEDAKVRLETIAELARQAPAPIGQDIYNNAYAGKIRRALDAAKGTK